MKVWEQANHRYHIDIPNKIGERNILWNILDYTTTDEKGKKKPIDFEKRCSVFHNCKNKHIRNEQPNENGIRDNNHISLPTKQAPKPHWKA